MPELKWNNIDGSAMNGALNGVLHATDSFGKSLTNIGDNLYKHTQQLQQNLRDVHDWEKEQNTQALLMKMNGATSQADIDALTAQGLVDSNQLLNQYGTRVDLSKIQQKQHSWLIDTQSRAKSADELKDFSQGSQEVQAQIQSAMNNRDFQSAMSLAQEAVASGMLSKTAAATYFKNINDMYESDRKYAIDQMRANADVGLTNAQIQKYTLDNQKTKFEDQKEIIKYITEGKNLSALVGDSSNLNQILKDANDATNTMSGVTKGIIKTYEDHVKQGTSPEKIREIINTKFKGDKTLPIFWTNLTGVENRRLGLVSKLEENNLYLVNALQNNPNLFNTLPKQYQEALIAQGYNPNQENGTLTWSTFSNVNGIGSQAYGSKTTNKTSNPNPSEVLSDTQGQSSNTGLTDINALANQAEVVEKGTSNNSSLVQEEGEKTFSKSAEVLNAEKQRQQTQASSEPNDSDIDSRVKEAVKNNYKPLDANDSTEMNLAYNYYRLMEEHENGLSTVSTEDIAKAKEALDIHNRKKQETILSGVTSGDSTKQADANQLLQQQLDNEDKEIKDRVASVNEGINNSLNQKTNHAIVEKSDKIFESVDWSSGTAVQDARAKYVEEVKKASKQFENDTTRQRAFEETQMKVFDEFVDALNSNNITDAEGKPIKNPKFSDFIAYKDREADALTEAAAKEELDRAFGNNGIWSKFNKEIRSGGVKLAKNGIGVDDVPLVLQDGTTEPVSPDKFAKNMLESIKAANSGSGGKLVDIYDNVREGDLKELQFILEKAPAEKKYILAQAIASTLNPLYEKAYKAGSKESTKNGSDEEWASATQEVADKLKDILRAAKSMSDGDIEQVKQAGQQYHQTITDSKTNAYSGFGKSMQDIKGAKEAHKNLSLKRNDSTLTQAMTRSNNPLIKKHLEIGSQLELQTKALDEKLALVNKHEKEANLDSYYGADIDSTEMKKILEAQKGLDKIGKIDTKAYKERLNYVKSMISLSDSGGYNTSDLKELKAELEKKIQQAETHNKQVKNSKK